MCVGEGGGEGTCCCVGVKVTLPFDELTQGEAPPKYKEKGRECRDDVSAAVFFVL